jgi:hypothetical protein
MFSMPKNNFIAQTVKDVKNVEDEEDIKLWVMSGASILKEKSTNEIVGYLCYCNNCKEKSVGGSGGIAFQTAGELLEHRNMKAFVCPCGCGFHVCEEFSSIIRHINQFHPEVMVALKEEGLNLEEKKKKWIYPDSVSNTYTLTKPMPVMKENESPLEYGGRILSITPQSPVSVSLPLQQPERVVSAPSKKGGKWVPFNLHGATPAPAAAAAAPASAAAAAPASAAAAAPASAAADAPVESKKWDIAPKQAAPSLATVLKEELLNKQGVQEQPVQIIKIKPTHYAQFDMRKEKQCVHGKECSKKDRPFACALNHDGKGDVILKGTELSEDVLCEHERPPFKRCNNTMCTHIHLEGREVYVNQRKTEYFQNHPQRGMSYSAIVGNLNGNTIQINTKDGHLTMSKDDLLEIATIAGFVVNADELEEQKTALEKFQKASEWTSVGKHGNAQSNKKEEKEERKKEQKKERTEEEEEDLSDENTFAQRAAAMSISM